MIGNCCTFTSENILRKRDILKKKRNLDKNPWFTEETAALQYEPPPLTQNGNYSKCCPDIWIFRILAAGRARCSAQRSARRARWRLRRRRSRRCSCSRSAPAKGPRPSWHSSHPRSPCLTCSEMETKSFKKPKRKDKWSKEKCCFN